uniref:Uncharacterized protein n=1 Tax=Alexandrium catenella TaxID=2925 RepID=A0A7S1L535_ALECA|mmetsp:Transcript_106702/g.283829  ORF Transcript_106702/g.283829 Transcript_106702/m.283829 type:complete len:563 (+) Transcript_106702:50-1738(+)|eukprot:CAMPEP_0171163642 /NCGR_PEP_ID=MMETSP0790-20130122/5254_1 /TAXON_ID=2925 /ORGANISM="Alexandrium catenella, Strain OF101" /LENGTH=562 /DNA_ID=CAMNT_0011628365 /DNA_START=47 /DNA_END=1735 /DNA_ORIENTATION=-
MRLPLDHFCPTAHRWLQVLHLDHLVEVNSATKAMLMVSSVISVGFSFGWLSDILQLTCFTGHPWTDEGIGQYTCLYKFLGGLVLLVMAKHSLIAWAYFDETDDGLRLKKERCLGELERQCGTVLRRATKQAKQLVGLLSADLEEKVNDHVARMQTILGRIEHDQDPQAQQLYERLATSMAHHLHGLRQPAIEHFRKLVALSGQARFLEEVLERERHESMVGLLTGKATGLPRTETGHSDLEVSLLLGGLVGHIHRGWTAACCCCSTGAAGPLQRRSSVELKFSLPTEADLQEELREPTPEERKRSPEQVVLRPMRLVLRWFEKIVPDHEAAARSPASAASGSAVDWGAPEREVCEQLAEVLLHLRRSPVYRCMLLGILASIAFFVFYWQTAGQVVGLLRAGSCRGPESVSCVGAFLRKVFGLCGMGCYAVSLTVVLWNVERLDAVLQVQEEIHEIEDFKRQIDRLNTQLLAEDDSNISMIQTIERQLAAQKRLVAAFYNDCWGGTVQLSRFEQLASELESALSKGRSLRERAGQLWKCTGGSARSYLPVSGENLTKGRQGGA